MLLEFLEKVTHRQLPEVYFGESSLTCSKLRKIGLLYNWIGLKVSWHVRGLWKCLMLSGMDSQTLCIHAEADWLWRSGWGHSHCTAA